MKMLSLNPLGDGIKLVEISFLKIVYEIKLKTIEVFEWSNYRHYIYIVDSGTNAEVIKSLVCNFRYRKVGTFMSKTHLATYDK